MIIMIANLYSASKKIQTKFQKLTAFFGVVGLSTKVMLYIAMFGCSQFGALIS